MPLIHHSPEFLAKQARRLASEQRAIQREKEIQQQKADLIESIAPEKQYTHDELMHHLAVSLRDGVSPIEQLTISELDFVHNILRKVRLNPAICKEFTGKSSIELMDTFQTIQNKLGRNQALNAIPIPPKSKGGRPKKNASLFVEQNPVKQDYIGKLMTPKPNSMIGKSLKDLPKDKRSGQ